MDRVSSVGPTPPGDDNDKGSAAAKRRASGEPSSGPAGMEGLDRPEARLVKTSARRKKAVHPTEEQVKSAARLLDDAEAMEIALKPPAVARHLGLEQASSARRMIETTRSKLPVVKTEAQRIAQLEQFQAQRARDLEQDKDCGARMTSWVAKLSDAERKALYVAPASVGGPQWMQPLTLRVGGRPDLGFAAGHLVNWPADVVTHLPHETRTMLAARQQTLSALNVDSGREVAAFIKEHFDCQTLDPKSAPPHELARLVELQPHLGPALQALRHGGTPLTLVRCKKTPDAVLDAIRHVAQTSQHKFVSTWLPDLVNAGIEPIVIGKDIAKVHTDHDKRKTKALHKFRNDGFRSALVSHQLDDALEQRLDIQGSIDLIKDFSKSSLYITGASPSVENRSLLGQVNESLRDHFGNEYARRRLTFDDANRTSEGAKAIITSLAVMAPVVEVMQDVMHLGPFAKSLAAAGDDAMSEAAELSALRAAGMTKQEMIRRMGIIGPAAAVALGMAGSIDEVVHEVGDHVGGAMYSSSAVFLSFVTCLLSIQYFAKHYKRLESENKLPPNLVLDEQTRGMLDALGKTNFSKNDVLKIVDGSLESSGASKAERAAVHDRLSRFSERRLLRRLRKQGVVKQRQKPLLAGMKEAVGVNPARLGLMAGTLSSPLMGLALGPWFLHQPVLYAVAGSFETMVGALSIWAYGRSFDSRWKRFVKQRSAQETPGDPPASKGKTETVDT